MRLTFAIAISTVLFTAAAAAPAQDAVVALPPQPGTTSDIRAEWSRSGKTILAALAGEYVTKRGFLVSTQEGPMAHAYFIIDAAAGKAKPFLRARECRFLPDGRILALNYAAFDTPAEDIRGISISPDREKNTKAAGIFSATGEFLKEAPAGFAGMPSPDGKRYLSGAEPDGRNNFQCVRKLSIVSETEAPIELAPPVAEKPGRLVGFRNYAWAGDSAVRASVLDMDAKEARRAPPGYWLNVAPEWYEYSLRTRAWEKLAGDRLAEAAAQRRDVEGGTLYFMDDAVKLVRGNETKTLAWPELKAAEVDVSGSVVSPDGRYVVVKVVPSSAGAPGKGAAPSGRGGYGAPGGPPPAAPAGEAKPPLTGLWLLDMSKPSKTRLEFPGEKGDPETERFDAMGWIGGGTFALVQRVARSTVTNARGTVVTDHKGSSYYLDAATGKLEPFAIEGIPWQPFLCERAAGGKERLAVLVRPGPGDPTRQEFRVAVIGPKGRARRIAPPDGFRVGYQSGLWFSPDGRTLVVSESRGPRLWLTPSN